jgi:hypothetical protein
VRQNAQNVINPYQNAAANAKAASKIEAGRMPGFFISSNFS